jgi:hypothetical protein
MRVCARARDFRTLTSRIASYDACLLSLRLSSTSLRFEMFDLAADSGGETFGVLDSARKSPGFSTHPFTSGRSASLSWRGTMTAGSVPSVLRTSSELLKLLVASVSKLLLVDAFDRKKDSSQLARRQLVEIRHFGNLRPGRSGARCHRCTEGSPSPLAA